MSIAVVIPYFQREPGILARALQSIEAQEGVDDLRIVIVDDASPVPARGEIATMSGTRRFGITIVDRANGGPAAARNTGLAALGSIDPAVAYVAFLDSDDTWSVDHLARAVEALECGYDFHFADLYQLGQTVSGFARAARIHLGDHRAIGTSPELFEFRGDMFDQIITGNVIGTSTVVFRREPFADLRFDEAFVNAGEDYLFWIACARRGARFCFSARVAATYGKGVNVYSGAGWGTPQYLRRVHDEMKYRKHLDAALPLNAPQRSFVRARIDNLRAEFAAGVIDRLKRRLPLDAALMKAHALLDPQSFFRIPISAGTQCGKVLRQRFFRK